MAPAKAPPLPACLGCHRSLATKLPAGIDEMIQVSLVFEDPDQSELFYSHAQTSLHLDHLHKSALFRLVVDRYTFA
ncbi:MAG: hypothetical protein P8X86_14785 [Desulfofustis sp.]